MTKLIKPMLLDTQDYVESNQGWLYEPKFDGFRLLVGNDISYTRHGTITTSRLPELLFKDSVPDVLMDGELIAPGEKSPDDFAGAMSRFHGNKKQSIQYRAFDLLKYRGKSLVKLSIQKRKEMLAEVMEQVDRNHLAAVPFVIGEGEALFEVIKANNMEGIVAKRLDSLYAAGTRSKEWRKIIHWSYHECIASKITYNPFTVQLTNAEGEYIGSVSIGFTKEVKQMLMQANLPFPVMVKARGWTSGGKLRLPQIIKVTGKEC